jgi:hypothetical protein
MICIALSFILQRKKSAYIFWSWPLANRFHFLNDSWHLLWWRWRICNVHPWNANEATETHAYTRFARHMYFFPVCTLAHTFYPAGWSLFHAPLGKHTSFCYWAFKPVLFIFANLLLFFSFWLQFAIFSALFTWCYPSLCMCHAHVISTHQCHDIYVSSNSIVFQQNSSIISLKINVFLIQIYCVGSSISVFKLRSDSSILPWTFISFILNFAIKIAIGRYHLSSDVVSLLFRHFDHRHAFVIIIEIFTCTQITYIFHASCTHSLTFAT